jgi:hypothetical protein
MTRWGMEVRCHRATEDPGQMPSLLHFNYQRTKEANPFVAFSGSFRSYRREEGDFVFWGWEEEVPDTAPVEG